MAILDFLVPDLAPEQYSSGQGTGYAQQYDLGAPNPFDVAQQYADKAVQAKQLQLQKDLLNEKNRQESFKKYIADLKYDPKWTLAVFVSGLIVVRIWLFIQFFIEIECLGWLCMCL